jgi:hypothetical protein
VSFVSIDRLDVTGEGVSRMQSWLEEAHPRGELKEDSLTGPLDAQTRAGGLFQGHLRFPGWPTNPRRSEAP